jgi:hypothetical protein
MSKKQSADKPNRADKSSAGRGDTAVADRNRRRATTGPAAGHEAVASYISSLPGWQQALAKRFDQLVEREIPHVRRGVKWTVPVYGLEGIGWIASFSAFANHVKLTFFRGAAFTPPLPGGKGKEMGFLDLKERDRLDERRVSSWIRQAAAGPGFGS